MTAVSEKTTPSVVTWEVVVQRVGLDHLPPSDQAKYHQFYEAQVLIVKGYIREASVILDELDKGGPWNGRCDDIIKLVRRNR